jgi:hypothetical protein
MFILTHPVNFPCGRKPEYPEKTQDFRQRPKRWLTLFTWVRSDNQTHDFRCEKRLLLRLQYASEAPHEQMTRKNLSKRTASRNSGHSQFCTVMISLDELPIFATTIRLMASNPASVKTFTKMRFLWRRCITFLPRITQVKTLALGSIDWRNKNTRASKISYENCLWPTKTNINCMDHYLKQLKYYLYTAKSQATNRDYGIQGSNPIGTGIH